MQLVRLACNVAQITEVCTLLAKNFPEVLSSDLLELILEFQLGDFVTTLGADRTDEVVLTPQFGVRFESLLAALRANDRGRVVHELSLAGH
ncbi:MAG TPA: hypothetical protein VGF96_16175 [Terracidiphilus sp.]|jgi:hypothetical protein